MATGTLDPRFSAPAAEPSAWKDVEAVLAGAGTYWLTTVRADGRPHVTPLIAVWYDGRLHFATGEGEQKFRNLAAHRQVVLTTGNNALATGLDVVVEGEAVRISEQPRLAELAAAWVAKYGEDWRFEVHDGGFWTAGGGSAAVFGVVADKVLAFRKEGAYAQTVWRPLAH
jgi:nitroimidazol reductase NimA-like FMN-containing flavoprotein (pyridoxamine 5'-phosphate oxidase superfamily)